MKRLKKDEKKGPNGPFFYNAVIITQRLSIIWSNFTDIA